MVDAVMDDMSGATTRSDVAEFRAHYHSYMYSLQDNTIATARLDRWYVSLANYGQISRVATASPVSRPDHDSVALDYYSRDAVPRSKGRASPQLRYPLPACAVDAVHARSRAMLESRGTELTRLEPAHSATEWDLLKDAVRRACLTQRRESMTAATARHKMRIRRLRRELKDARVAASHRLVDGHVTIDELTTRLSALALDPAARYCSIRRTIITAQEPRSSLTGHMRHAKYAGRPHESSKAFYRRISIKLCRRATHSLPLIPGSTVGAADRIAHDWRPITQRPPMDAAAQDRIFDTLSPKTVSPDLSELDEPFTEAEVERAIKACPRGKACGPDGLGNDWYREHGDVLAPLLAPLYSHWYASRILPPSFATATVFCAPKKSDPATGLDFRPIALLNTDYKIYARLLLHRVRGAVPRLESATQYGFVPGRQVHDPIDIWAALQRRATSKVIAELAVAVLLDFAKAYDSLDRRFLSLALARHGFSAAMIQAVATMHLGTTAAYITDGQTSATEAVTTGIRQGCPFAPTLFILAVDVLYEIIVEDSRLPGLQLDDSISVVIVGFADDTNAYLSSEAEAHALVEILAHFATASGLVVNTSKSLAVRMRPSEGSTRQDLGGFPLASDTQLVRYLGAQISTTPQQGRVWDVVLQQLRARLYLAEIKTTDLLQRVQVCQAVILPKIRFVARHSWPSSANIVRPQRFVHNYAWHGILTDDGILRRAYVSAAVASSHRADGGLQLPNIRTELLLLSAATVRRWLSAQDLLAAAVGRLLIEARAHHDESLLIAPARGPAPGVRIGGSMATSGFSMLRAAACHPREVDERDAILPLLGLAGRAPVREAWWEHGWYCRDCTRHAPTLSIVKRLQRARYGKLNVASLLATPVLGHGLLLHPSGREVVASDFPGLVCSTARLGDLVEFQWARQSLARFRLRGSTYPYSMAASFRRLCDLLVMCYPGVLAPQTPPELLTERSRSTDTWRLHEEGGGLHLIREVGPHERLDLGVVASLQHAQAAARRATGRRRVHFAPHPLLSVARPIWGSTELYSKTCLRRLATGAPATNATRELERRHEAVVAQSAAFATALDSVSWSDVHGLPHSSSRQRLLFHKIKGKRVSGWDVLNHRQGCPHCDHALSTGGDLYHVVWDCPSAQRLWRSVRLWWASLGLWTKSSAATTREFLTAAFSLRLPRVPAKVHEMATLSQRPSPDDAPEGPFPALQAAWQQIVLETLVVILGWRRSRFDPERAWTAGQAAVIHAASCQKILGTLALRCANDARAPSTHAQLIRELRALFQGIDLAVEPQLDPPPSTALHVLFFDGGSRGNPGPGGSGACVVRVDGDHGAATVVWSAAMSRAHPSTTNNQAEYHGLLTGLRAARIHQWTALEVVGDSAIIIRQLRDYRPPPPTPVRTGQEAG